MQNKTVFLKNYESPCFAIEKIDLDFDLYDTHAIVKNQMVIQRIKPGSLHLFGDELILEALYLNQTKLSSTEYELKEGDLIIPEVPDQFTLTIVTRIEPQNNLALSGLYRSNHLFCTQCEAEGFRRITFYIDRPDVLSIYSTRITADKEKYPILLSNGNKMDEGDLPNGRHWALWQDPFKKPSYLFALVAGNLVGVKDHFETASGRKVDLFIYVEPGNEDKCAHAMHSLKKAMRWDEEEYGREYDLDLYMIVAVNDFNMGAMENKGLNIFNAKYILARPDTASDQDYIAIESVVAHEYFHNWTGNRVTCRDWFQLSLKEGLTVFRDQEFTRDLNSRDVYRIMDVKILKQTQFPEDAGRMAHPVRPESYQEINNFYTATVYNKGAEVIRMQQALLGKVGFRKGTDLYFKRHDGQAVTIDDFVAAMSDANHYDMQQFKLWYSQAGTPQVTVTSETFNNGTLTISFSQTCPKTPDNQEKSAFVIPIRYRLYDGYGEPMNHADELFVLKQHHQTFEVSGLKEKPLVTLLQDFSAPVHLKREISFEDKLLMMRYEENGFVKWDIAQQLALNTLMECYQAPRGTWAISDELLKIYRDILNDETLDYALRAELIAPPQFEIIAGMISNVDVTLLEEVRDFYRYTLSTALSQDARVLYQRLVQLEDHAMNAQAFHRRRLKNLCLWLLSKAHHPDRIALCRQQYSQSKTMSDQLSSIGLIVDMDNETLRAETLAHFYQQWADEDLVLDKWFSIQATTELPTALFEVKGLMQHPKFVMTNPNKVRALIGAFIQGNHRHFHAIDGSGYRFLTDILIELDPINAQVAARLATPFTRWQRYDQPRQALMLKELQRLSKHQLSPDLAELVNKSLVNV